MPKPASQSTYTIADFNHALGVVAEYIQRTGHDNVWCIIERLEKEKEKLETRQKKLNKYINYNNKTT